MLRSPTTTLLLLAALATSPAQAASNSLFTVGVGTAVGVSQRTSLGSEPVATFASEVSIKIKALHVLGLELAYSPVDDIRQGGLAFDSRLRLSVLLYVVPTSPVSFYVKAGLGGGDAADAVDVAGLTTSYHGGAGLDVNIGDHWVVGAEFLLLVPGVASIRSTLGDAAQSEVSRAQGAAPAPRAVPSVADFISADNFRLQVSARYYF